MHRGGRAARMSSGPASVMRSPNPVSRMAACEAGQCLRAAVHRAGDGQAPVVVRERAQRAHQDVVGLARDDGADGQQLDRFAGAARARRRIGARLGDGDRSFAHAEVRNQDARRRPAGGDDAAGQRQGRGLECAQLSLAGLGKAGLEAQRMMHERDDGRGDAADEVRGDRAIGETVDDEHGARRDGRQPALRLGEIGSAWIGKRARQLQVLRDDPLAREKRQHAAVVGVAAGRQVDVAGDGEGRGDSHWALSAAHTGPSKKARARSVSCRVTRILARPLPSSPSAPSLAALAIASNT